MSYIPRLEKIVLKNENLKNTGSTLIGRTENGSSRFYPLFAVIEIAAATSISVVGAASIGTNSTNYNNILAITTLTGLSALNNILNLNLAGVASTSVAPNTDIYFKVTTGFTATTATGDIHLIGYYN